MADPVALILGALAAGAALGLRETASEAIRDAYHSLKALIQRKISGRSSSDLLDKYEKDPDTWKTLLKEALIEAAVDKDEKVIQVATELMKLANSQKAEGSKFNVHFHGKVGDVFVAERAEVHKYGDKQADNKSV